MPTFPVTAFIGSWGMERQYARTIAPNRHARENTSCDYFNGPCPRFRVDIHARCRLWVWREIRAQKRLSDRRATTGMVKKYKGLMIANISISAPLNATPILGLRPARKRSRTKATHFDLSGYGVCRHSGKRTSFLSSSDWDGCML